METDYYHASGAAVTNFNDHLPLPQAQLAQEITKGNYDLGFITLPANYDEKALENALEQNITRFLLELGTGFAFVGRQKEILVSGKNRKDRAGGRRIQVIAGNIAGVKNKKSGRTGAEGAGGRKKERTAVKPSSLLEKPLFS